MLPFLGLLTGVQNGLSARDIAEETGASLPQIRSAIVRLGKTVRSKGNTAARRYWARAKNLGRTLANAAMPRRALWVRRRAALRKPLAQRPKRLKKRPNPRPRMPTHPNTLRPPSDR